MELRAGYKQTEVGVIPEDWNALPVGGEIDLLTGFPFPSSGYTASGIRLLRGSNVKRGVTDWSPDITQYWPTVTNDLVNYQLREGDLVIAMDGSLVGRSSAQLERADLPALLLQRVARIRSTKKLDVSYLAAFVKSDWFVRHADSVKTVTAIPHISPADIRSFTIPIPPSIPEQRAIATALSDVDALLAKIDQLITKKRDLKQAAMQQLLTGQTRLPGFSGEWEVKRIGDDIDLLTGFPFPSAGYSSSGIRLLRGSNVKRGVTDWTDEISQYWPRTNAEISRYELRAGDLVIAMDGSLVGRSYAQLSQHDLPALLLQRVARIRSTRRIHAGYLAAFVGSEWFVNYADSVKTVTAIPHISPGDIRNFTISIPPSIAEQTAIASVLSDMDAELTALEARRDKTQALKQGMMQALLTGRIRLAGEN